MMGGGRTSGTEGTVWFNGWAVPSPVSAGPTESRTSRFGSLITMRCAGDNAAVSSSRRAVSGMSVHDMERERVGCAAQEDFLVA